MYRGRFYCLHLGYPRSTGFLRSRREKRKEKKAKKKKDLVETSSNKEEKSDLSVYACTADLVHIESVSQPANRESRVDNDHIVYLACRSPVVESLNLYRDVCSPLSLDVNLRLGIDFTLSKVSHSRSLNV